MTLTPHLSDPDFVLYLGDALDVLRQLPEQHVHCIVCSPPYWGLRDYGVEGQVGLESTPQEYVSSMVGIFSEARRVLRDDGTLWLNLGDSYASNWGSGRKASWISSNSGEDEGRGWGVETALPPNMWRGTTIKPKDLVGIPWSVALALRDGHYKGKIKNELDRVWLAATVEAEGCLFIHRRKAGQPNGQGYERKSDTFGSGLEVASTDRVVVERCLAIAGVGSICEQTPEKNKRRKQTIYRWNVRSNECRWVIKELYPHMIAKQHEARLLIGCPSSGEDARKAWDSLKNLHQGKAACIDFRPPEGMWERGWFLRSEIIWAKLFRTPCLNPVAIDLQNLMSRFSCSPKSRTTTLIKTQSGSLTTMTDARSRPFKDEKVLFSTAMASVGLVLAGLVTLLGLPRPVTAMMSRSRWR